MTLYKIIFYLLKFLTRSEGSSSNLWYRNSLYFKNISFLRSDIDITYLYDDLSNVKKFNKKYKVFKYLVPILGEVNIYNREMLKIIEPHFNPHELRRDCTLSKITHNLQIENNFTKLVFLLRMYKADSQKILTGKFNTKKWKSYLSLIGVVETTLISNRNQLNSFIFDNYIKPLGKISFSEFVSVVNTFKEKTLNNDIASRFFLIFYPIEWMTLSLATNSFNNEGQLFRPLELNEKKVIYHQLEWEIVGVCSQFFDINDRNNIRLHFENIIRLLKKLEISDENKLEEAINNLFVHFKSSLMYTE